MHYWVSFLLVASLLFLSFAEIDHYVTDEVEDCASLSNSFWHKQWGICYTPESVVCSGYVATYVCPYSDLATVDWKCSKDETNHISYRLQYDGTFLLLGISGISSKRFLFILDVDAAARSGSSNLSLMSSLQQPINLKSNYVITSSFAPKRSLRILHLTSTSNILGNIYDKMSGWMMDDASKYPVEISLFAHENSNNTGTDEKEIASVFDGISIFSFAKIGVSEDVLRYFGRDILKIRSLSENGTQVNSITLNEVNCSMDVSLVHGHHCTYTHDVRMLIQFMKQFDAILYREQGWSSSDVDMSGLTGSPSVLKSSLTVFLHIAWLANVKLVRYFDESLVHDNLASKRYPASGYLLDSFDMMDNNIIRMEIGPLRTADPYMVIPPFVDPHSKSRTVNVTGIKSSFHVVFAGGMRPYACPGAFVRLVHVLVEMASTSDNDIRFEFTMYGSGALLAGMHMLLRSFGLEDVVKVIGTTASDVPFHFVQNKKEFLELMETADVLVDPCSKTAGNSFAFPTAMAYRVPVVAFATSGSLEWLFNETAVIVQELSLDAMARTVVSLATRPPDDANLSTASTFVAKTMTIKEVADAVNSCLYAVVYGIANALVIPSVGQMYGGRHTRFVVDSLDSSLPRDSRTPRVNEESGIPLAAPRSADSNIFSTLPVVNVSKFHALWRSGDLQDKQRDCSFHDEPQRRMVQLVNMSRLSQSPQPPQPPQSVLSDAASTHRGRLLCAVYSLKSGHETRVRNKIDTWGKRCDGFITFSDETDSDVNAIPTMGLFVNTTQAIGEHYHSMWQKVRNIWKYIAARYTRLKTGDSLDGSQEVEHFDWFLLGGDDLYVLVENLKDYLESVCDQGNCDAVPYYLGRTLRHSRNLVYNTGGAGYVLNAVAVMKLVTLLDSRACFSQVSGSIEDIMVGYCLAELGIYPIDTRDAHGRERFHWFDPYVSYTGDDEYYQLNTDTTRFEFPLKIEEECCSERSVSFHNMKTKTYTECFHSIVYGL